MKKLFLMVASAALVGCGFRAPEATKQPSIGTDLPIIDQALDPTACPKILQPVCGELAVPCFAAPCAPVRQTFSNECLARKSGAINITDGSCSR